ncbi:MAG: NAD(P)H-hydrate dehydratase [Deltaproteobacteria bacterium]|nr:NAD(P)H-hydrate dehydratase [Deltaproteobacteria bacterium]
MKVSTVDEMRRMDRRATEEHKIPGEILMEHAGHAVYDVIRARACEGIAGREVVVLCGVGHNGGDGLVVARKLFSAGALVKTFLLAEASKYGGTPRLNYEMLRGCGAEIVETPKVAEVSAALETAEVVVDAVFGTGLARSVEGYYHQVLEALEARRHRPQRPVVYSVDIPSGVHGDSGQIMGIAVQADVTVTFGLPKQGNLLYPGAGFCGELYVSPISFPPVLQRNDALAVRLSEPSRLPQRRPDGHKGSFGDTLFIAGAASYYGAPALAAMAHLRAGGGYSRLAAPRSVTEVVATMASEVVLAPQKETAAGSLSFDNAASLAFLADRVDVVVLGPGLSLGDETKRLVRQLTADINKPLVIDGDGLTAIAGYPDVVSHREAPTVLTPHSGEMVRISGRSQEDLAADPIAALRSTAAKFNAYIVLKGAHSLIGAPDGEVFINNSGNSGMATAGSGDVLTGTISAMLGQGLGLGDAIRTAVFLHGLAGDLAADHEGEDGMIARDILAHLPKALRVYRDDYEALTADFCGAVHCV